MKSNQASKLNIGDVVVFSDGAKGTISQIGYKMAWINWEDGQPGCIDFRDFAEIELVKTHKLTRV